MKRLPYTDHRVNWPDQRSKFKNSKEYIDATVKKYYNDAIAFARTLKTSFISDADKESFALEALYEAAGLYDSTRGMKFTSFLYLRVRQFLLRELKLVKGQRRCAQIPFADIFDQSATDTSDEVDPTAVKAKLRSVNDIPESATTLYSDNGSSRTIFDVFHVKELPAQFDLAELVDLLHNRLNETQRLILQRMLTDDISGTAIAKELGVSRQAVNLHLKTIRRHTKSILRWLAPTVKTGE